MFKTLNSSQLIEALIANRCQRGSFRISRGSTCNKDAGIFNQQNPSDFLKTDNPELYHAIVEHRRMVTSMKEVDYSTHVPKKINFVPPIAIIDLWRKDYETMQSDIIYGDSLSFNRLIDRIKELNERFRQTKI